MGPILVFLEAPKLFLLEFLFDVCFILFLFWVFL